MHRVLVLAAVAATLTIAACGGSSSNSDQAAVGAGASNTVGIKQVSGVGRVLVGPTGLALYTPDQEAKGMISCTAACTSVWQPVAAGGKPTAATGAGQVGVIKRPDGARQLTLDGMPAYTFVQDSPSQVTGDGAKDQFGGRNFTWHVLLAGGAKGTGSSGGTNNQYGY
jgi:predicted lipoprotein with Yx(FWY)xxD motif